MSKGLYSFTLVVFSFLFSTQLHSQQKLTLESLVPPAPNAAELGKYGTIPVGTLTGVPEISFPLYEINTGKLKLPVTLSYHASGIQVNQKATDAGLGWSIMAGGQISRTVYGSPDDSYYGYFNYDPPSYETLLGITNYYTMQQYNNNPSYDLEPDLFVYNMGGRSGKFICKKDKSFMTIPFDPIKIQKNTDGQNKVRFQIVDDNGTIYQFNEYSNTNSDENVVRQTVSTWYLTAMISADLTDTISFVYDRIFIDDEIKQEVWPVGQGHEQGTYVQGSGQLQVINKTINYNELLIKKIIFKNGYVQFNRNTVRKDASITSQGCNSLDEMVVYNADNQAIKKITFNHNYFTATPFEDNWAHYRLKLTGFIESDPNATIKKEYKFDYDATALPRYNSYSVDYWGYYNGVSNSGLIPAATVYASEINSIAGTNWSPGQSWNIGNSNREPSATHMKAGILNKVTYPTGGYSLFDYEPHKYISDEYIKRTVTKEGRTNGIDKFTKSVDTFSIIYPSESNLQSVNPNSISANLNIYFSVSNMGNTDNADLITQRVTLINKTNNTIIKIWKHEGDLTIPNSVSEPITLWAGQTYEIKHEVYGNSAVYINSDITWSENTTQHPIKIGGGLRLKSVKSYTSDTMLAKEENYSYGTAEDGLGVKLFNEKKFYKNYEDVALDYFRYGAGSLMCVKYATYGLRKFLGISKYNSLNYMGSPILYSTVIKYEGTSASNIGKTVYNYNIVFDDTYAPDLFINSGNYGAINNAWHQGELTDETFYKYEGGQYTPVAKNTYEYIKYNQTEEYGIQLIQHKQFIKTEDCATYPEGPDPGNSMPGQGYFSFYQYPIKTGASRRTKETRIVYSQQSGGSAISTVTTTQYQNPIHLYPTEIALTVSDGNKKITRLKYPQDVADPVHSAMIAKNMISPPVEEKLFRVAGSTETVLSTAQTKYKQTGNLIKPDTIKVSQYANSPEARILFNQYDINGNLVEQQKSNDVKEVYLWGYKSAYPVAKILNTTYAVAKTYITQSILDHPTSDEALRTHLDNLRNISGALVTTYTYNPLVGVTSETDANGRTTYYEYDGLGRLKLVRDQDNRILKKFSYNYQGQVEN